MRQVNNKNIRYLLTGLLFVFYFLYFALFNRYHINHLEQNQLFIWRTDFFKELFSLQGGLPLLFGRFFTQFFISSLLGALIYSLNALAVFLLSFYIFKQHSFKNIVVSFVPVWLLAILQSNEFFTFSQAAGFLLYLSFFALYISVGRSKLRYSLFLTGWPVFFLLTGGYSIPVVLLCIIHELVFRKERSRFLISFVYVILAALIPYLSAKFIFFIQPDKIYLYPVNIQLPSLFKFAIIILFSWIPFILLITGILPGRIRSFKERLVPWTIANVLTGMIIFLLMTFVVYKKAYNRMAEMMLGTDHYAQKAEWGSLLKISEKYPGYNTLVIYYTDLALYKSGKLLDKMFFYPQFGSPGLRLKWQRNLNLFFGGEVFYQLAYNNESIHWAFEALVAEGLNPRSLKKLASGFIVNGNYDIARKYLNMLNRTLFYRKWAMQNLKYLSNPGSSDPDPDIAQARNLVAQTNFFSEVNGMNLEDLLKNHPENKMAYEYLLASLLLDRNIDDFVKVVPDLKNYGYSRLPLHIEEAMIFYNFYERKNIIPPGYSIRQETINKFNDYARIYSMYRNNRQVAAYELRKKYGNTYWYYLQFPNN
jgi:hypothetical protein